MNCRNALYVMAGLAAVAGLGGFAFTRGPLAPPTVTVATARHTALQPEVFGVGTLEARRAYAVGPTQPGRVRRVLVDQGETVRPGQLLAEMDPVDLHERIASSEYAIERAQKMVLLAEANLREAQSRRAVASANANRYRDLQQKNFVSSEFADNKQNEAAVSLAAVDGARASLEAAGRDADKSRQERRALEKQLHNLKLTSPVHGVVVARSAEPGSTAVAGQAVVKLVDPSSFWVEARIDQAQVGGIRRGQEVAITLRSAPAAVRKGRVARVDLQSDRVTEERIVNVEFVDEPGILSIGELAEVVIRLPPLPQVLAVPTAALRQLDQRRGVWQLVEGKARYRDVKTAVQTLAGETQVIEGLKAGDEVIVHSASPLREGQTVRVRR